MDRLDQEIIEKMREVSDLKKRVEMLEVEVRVLRRAAELRPHSVAAGVNALPDTKPAIENPTRRGGRQPGSISKPWRGVLKDIATTGNRGVNAAELALLAGRRGIDIQERSARETAKRYVGQGLLEENVVGDYRVTGEAIQRFNLLGDASHQKDEDHPDNTAAPH